MPIFKVNYKVDPEYASTGVPKYHDSNALGSVLSYCMDPSKAAYVGGLGVNVQQAAYEMEQVARAFGHENGLHLRHWILSFDPKELRGYKRNLLHFLQGVAWKAASYYGGQYQIVYVIHLDSECPNIHFIMSTTNYRTGNKYPGDKADYYAYQSFLREFFELYKMQLLVYDS